MSYRSKREVTESIKTYETTKKDGRKYTVYTAFFGTDPITKLKKRVAKASLKDLEKYIDDFYRRLNKGGDSAVLLTPYQSMDAKNAYIILEANNMAITLTELAKKFVSGDVSMKVADSPSKKLGEAFREYIATFPDGLHKKTINSRVGKWVVSFGGDRDLSSVSAQLVSSYLKQTCSASNKTYNNYLSYIKTFLNWCAKKERGWLKTNPCEDMSMMTIAYKEPEYISVADAKRLFDRLWELRETKADMLAYAVLSFMTGTRREEIIRMAEMEDAAKISIEDETVRISKPKGYTKGISPRAFTILPNALAWMKSFKFAEGVKQITEYTTKALRQVSDELNISLPKNAGRHSFITYHVAAFGDPSKTEAMVGTSKKMRVSNYCGLASKKDGLSYFEILPPTR